jgi:hypothetical protein
MHDETKYILKSWQALEKGEGLKAAASMVRMLRLLNVGLFLFIVAALYFHLHPGLIAVAGLAHGWATAEANALRWRIAQWPTVRNYLDWDRVNKDLGDDQAA